MSAEAVHDWPALFKEFWKEHRSTGLIQKVWAEQKGLSETFVAREFAAIRKSRAEAQIEKARLLIASKAPKAAKKLVSLSETSEDENIQLKASTAILGAVGISSQAAIQINNNTQVNILAVPIFASVASPMMDKFLGSVDADTKTDS